MKKMNENCKTYAYFNLSMNTHSDFKSVQTSIVNAADINECVGYAIEFQEMFDRRIPPSDAMLWAKDELKDFTIDLSMIDRLFYIHYAGEEQGYDGEEFVMGARMDYKKRKVYVELNVGCNSWGFGYGEGGGNIFVCDNANLFFKVVMTPKYDHERICALLKSDNILIEDCTEYEKCSLFNKRTIKSLTFWCYHATYLNRHRLQYQFTQAPNVIQKQINNFIDLVDAKDAYNS